jgi:hypothetical protein
MKTGIEVIAEERQRQILVEGWTCEHDDTHTSSSMAMAAVSYAIMAASFYRWNSQKELAELLWPPEWGKEWWKPSKDPIRNLAKAGALIAAEIDRLQRLQQKNI